MGENKEKLSYEQLEEVARQMEGQLRQVYAKLQDANMQNLFKRLDFLFKVLETEHMFPLAFVQKCADEIKSILTIPEEAAKEDKDEDPDEEGPVEETETKSAAKVVAMPTAEA